MKIGLYFNLLTKNPKSPWAQRSHFLGARGMEPGSLKMSYGQVTFLTNILFFVILAWNSIDDLRNPANAGLSIWSLVKPELVVCVAICLGFDVILFLVAMLDLRVYRGQK